MSQGCPLTKNKWKFKLVGSDGNPILAGNFDKERSNEKPSMDEYSKVTK